MDASAKRKRKRKERGPIFIPRAITESSGLTLLLAFDPSRSDSKITTDNEHSCVCNTTNETARPGPTKRPDMDGKMRKRSKEGIKTILTPPS